MHNYKYQFIRIFSHSDCEYPFDTYLYRNIIFSPITQFTCMLYRDPTPFVAKGSNSSWLPVIGSNTRYMHISDIIQMTLHPLLEKRVRFWETLYRFVSPLLWNVSGQAHNIIGTAAVVVLTLSVFLLLSLICFDYKHQVRKQYIALE